jgi:hypothetical protein
MALSAEELLGWLEPKVSRYKMPRKVYFWDALPRSGYGKVTKKLVKEEMQLRGLLEQAEGAKDVSNGPQAVSPDRPEASEPMRLIRQPGKLAVARALAVPVGIVTLDAMLPAGTNLISGLAAGSWHRVGLQPSGAAELFVRHPRMNLSMRVRRKPPPAPGPERWETIFSLPCHVVRSRWPARLWPCAVGFRRGEQPDAGARRRHGWRAF